MIRPLPMRQRLTVAAIALSSTALSLSAITIAPEHSLLRVVLLIAAVLASIVAVVLILRTRRTW